MVNASRAVKPSSELRAKADYHDSSFIRLRLLDWLRTEITILCRSVELYLGFVVSRKNGFPFPAQSLGC